MEEGKEREAIVDRLCQAAEARGEVVIRDKAAMRIGDRISIFMDRIGKGAVNGRVCIVLSDAYLRSPYCMHELFDVWRNCREEDATFIERTRVFVLPSAQISTAIERSTSFTGKPVSRNSTPWSRSMGSSCCPTRTMSSSDL